MKRFSELTEEQKEKAISKVVNDFLTDIVEGAIRFNDKANGDNLQESIDQAMQEAERMRTPWFASEYVWDADYVEFGEVRKVSDLIRSLAMPVVEDALYPESGEAVIRI